MVYKLGFVFITLAALFCAAGSINLFLGGHKVTTGALIVLQFLSTAASVSCMLMADYIPFKWIYVMFILISIMIMIFQFNYSSTLI